MRSTLKLFEKVNLAAKSETLLKDEEKKNRDVNCETRGKKYYRFLGPMRDSYSVPHYPRPHSTATSTTSFVDWRKIQANLEKFVWLKSCYNISYLYVFIYDRNGWKSWYNLFSGKLIHGFAEQFFFLWVFVWEGLGWANFKVMIRNWMRIKYM